MPSADVGGIEFHLVLKLSSAGKLDLPFLLDHLNHTGALASLWTFAPFRASRGRFKSQTGKFCNL